MKPGSVDGFVVAKLMKLHPDDIPRHLMQKNQARTAKDFDPNAYLTVLTHLAMKPGCILDYVYRYMDGLGGDPCLYARSVKVEPKPAVEIFADRGSVT